ncbi:MAG: O-antigen ligase family protein [Phycisphaerae bacterium]|nr:O-antigen ligase family protein [Phycisphaerae bacterium]
MPRAHAQTTAAGLRFLSLVVLVLVVSLRPMIAESYDTARSPFGSAISQIADPTPVRTLVLDVSILLAACASLVAHRMERSRRPRWPGLEWGLALCAFAALISCVFAGQKRLAINGAIDWLCLPILALTLADLLRRDGQRRLLLAAILGAAATQVATGVEQYRGFEDTWAQYQQHKAEFWAAQGIQPGDGRIELFERRANSREIQASFPHSNVAASYFLLCVFAAAGAALDRWRVAVASRAAPQLLLALGSTALAAALVGTLAFTGSLGAMLAGVAGLALWIVVIALRSWIARHRRLALRIGWGVALAAAVAFISWGLIRQSFPSMSLTFRWQYWTAAARMIADHPLTGVGRENFGRHYLQYKSIASPEEVSNPHNFLVQFAADWGLLGLAGAIVLLVAGVNAVTRPRANPPPSPEANDADPRDVRTSAGGISKDTPLTALDSPRRAVIWMCLLIASITLLRLPLLGSENFAFLYYNSVLAALSFAIGFIMVAMPRTAAPAIAPPSTRIANDGVAPRVIQFDLAIAVGLFAFLVSDLINFSLFVPGSATTFFAFLGLALSTRRTNASSEQQALACANTRPPKPGTVSSAMAYLRRTSPLPYVTGALAFAAIFLGLIPVACSAHALAEARRLTAEPYSGEPLYHPAYPAFQRAADLDPFDSTALRECSLWLFSLAESIPPENDAARQYALQALRMARVTRDPYDLSSRRRLARIDMALGNRTGDEKDYRAAVAAAEAALRLYPESPESLILLADIERGAADGMNAADLRARAVEHYRAALDMDRSRPPWAEFNRLPQREVERVEKAIAEMTMPARGE